ncbi:hypothetical protein NPIL_481071, partial [Nephila pilipes]
MYTDDDPENDISRLFNYNSRYISLTDISRSLSENYNSRYISLTDISRSLSENYNSRSLSLTDIPRSLSENTSRSSSSIDISVLFNTNNLENNISRSLSLNDIDINISGTLSLIDSEENISSNLWWTNDRLINHLYWPFFPLNHAYLNGLFYSLSLEDLRSSSEDLELSFRRNTQQSRLYEDYNSTLIPDIDDIIITKEFLNNECSICLDMFKLNEDAKKLLCNHLFHANCITTWIKEKDTCP